MRTVEDNYRWFCESLLKHAKLDGKMILDVGCGDGGLVRFIAKEYSPEYVVGVEPALSEYWDTEASEGSNWRVQYGNAYELEFTDNAFDLVVSLSTFEHISDVAKALAEIKRVLKPYGRFYTEFSPIWTSAAGHHFLRGKDRWWTEEHILAIPAWSHLFLSETEMKQQLIDTGTDDTLIKEMLNFIYHSDYVNRHSRAALSQLLLNSKMIIRYYEERVTFNRLGFTTVTGDNTSELTDEIKLYIERSKYSVSDLGVAGMRVCLEKYESF